MNDPLGVLGMAIERFQTFALYRDQRRLTKRFSIAWFFASWTFALCFLFVLLSQIEEIKVHQVIEAGLGDENQDSKSPDSHNLKTGLIRLEINSI